MAVTQGRHATRTLGHGPGSSSYPRRTREREHEENGTAKTRHTPPSCLVVFARSLDVPAR